jgi:hypothetical protein
MRGFLSLLSSLRTFVDAVGPKVLRVIPSLSRSTWGGHGSFLSSFHFEATGEWGTFVWEVNVKGGIGCKRVDVLVTLYV